jgi:hypothetical protein
MSDHKYPAYQPTGAETLEKLVMDPNIPKSETEGWSCREIERLRARVEVLERALHAAKDAMAAVSVPRDNERAILFQAYDAALVALEAKP